MTRQQPIRARVLLPLATAVAVTAGLLVGAGPASAEHSGHEHVVVSVGRLNAQQVAFHDAMRKLWEDHVTWTRLAIVSFAGGLPDLTVTEQRLLQNQQDIGDAVAPFYGTAAGEHLTALLRQHILIAVDLLVDAKAGNTAQFARDKRRWYANADQIADFLAAANPRHWTRTELRQMMRTHLDETLKEAADRLGGHFAADVKDYDAVVHHILLMADTLSTGIMQQFPGKFQ